MRQPGSSHRGLSCERSSNSTETTVRKDGSSSKRGAGGGGRSSSGTVEQEVDVYRNPTRLFELIDVGDDDGAVRHVHANPSEAATWLVSRRGRGIGGRGGVRGDPSVPGDREPSSDAAAVADVKWRYLPLHLVCLRPSPSLPLVRSLVNAYPRAVRKRDRTGNLPVHYVCLEGTEDDWEVLQFLLDAYPDSLNKHSGDGRTLTQLVQDMGNSDEGSLATNGTMIARVSNYGRRGRQVDGAGRGADGGAQPLEQRGDAAAEQHHRSKSRGRGGGTEERRDQPEGRNYASRFEPKPSGDSQSHPQRSKSRRRGGDGRNERPAREQHHPLSPLTDKDEKLRKKVINLEGKLDAALTERDVMQENMDNVVGRDKARSKEVKVLRQRLDAALGHAEEYQREAESEHQRAEELGVQLIKEEGKSQMLQSKVVELEQANEYWEQQAQDKEDELMKAVSAAKDAEKDAAEARRIRAEAHDVERGLLARIATLESELEKRHGAEERCEQLLRERESEAKDHRAVQLMNSSLQDQIAVTKTKCNNLERKGKEVAAERDALQARLLSSPSKMKQESRSELGERQKQLHKEFSSLWSALQSMSKDSPVMAKILSGEENSSGANAAESLAHSMEVMTAENEAREKKIKSCKAKIEELERENEGLREEVKRAEADRQILEDEVRRAKAAGGENSNNAKLQLGLEVHVKELQAKNKSLRDKITKNNATYVAKVEELGEEYARLQDENVTLQSTIRELRAKDTVQKRRFEKGNLNTESSAESSIDGSKMTELSRRVSSVAGFLVKISDMQDRIVTYATRMEEEMKSRTETPAQNLMPSERDEMEAMAKAARERGELLNNAVAIQKRELEAIAVVLSSTGSQ